MARWLPAVPLRDPGRVLAAMAGRLLQRIGRAAAARGRGAGRKPGCRQGPEPDWLKEIGLHLDDQSAISEITILPDGRVYLFGASRQVLEILYAIPLGDPALKRRIECLLPSASPGEKQFTTDHDVIAEANEGVTR